jgi:hypothetical protein
MHLCALGITGFRVPLHSPICSLSLLFSPTKFSANKIFPTSTVRVCLCFHSQSRLKNPEHLKFLRMSSVHHHDCWGQQSWSGQWTAPVLGNYHLDGIIWFLFERILGIIILTGRVAAPGGSSSLSKSYYQFCPFWNPR